MAVSTNLYVRQHKPSSKENFNVSTVSPCSTAHNTEPESPMALRWGPPRARFHE